jgi:CIC family chloride channel protein
VLAPLLMMGGALGGLEAMVLPNEGLGFWPLVSMGAILGGTMRSPFTGVIFSLELTRDVNMLLPLLVAVTLAHAFTVLTLRRSILTEKVSRRGYHLSREYAVDPLEILFVREVMRTNVVAFPATTSLHELAQSLGSDHHRRRQRLYPVVEPGSHLVGVVTDNDLRNLLQEVQSGGNGQPLAELIRPNPAIAYPDEPLRMVVYRMAETGFTRLPVVSRHAPGRLVGIISLSDLLQARVHHLEEERRRERILQVRLFGPLRPRRLHRAE